MWKRVPGGERARVEGSRRRFPVRVRVRRVHRVTHRGGRLCREVLGHAGRLRPHRRGHGAGEGPLCARRAARAWLSREQGRRGSRARGIEPCGHEFLARGRWWEAVEGAPRSDQARARCREGAGRCRRGASACIRRRGRRPPRWRGQSRYSVRLGVWGGDVAEVVRGRDTRNGGDWCISSIWASNSRRGA